MTKYGKNFSATDGLKKAAGQSHNAQVVAFGNAFDLAVDGNTAQALKIADLPAGVVPLYFTIDCDQNVSALTFKLGTTADDDLYGAAANGPNATVQTRHVPVALGLTPTQAAAEVFLTPSGNMPATGNLRVVIYGTQR